MKKRRETFSRKLNEVSQQLRSITDVISKNKQEIDKESTAAKNAETRFASSTDPEEKLRMQMARNVRSNQVVRLTQSNVTFEQLKKTLKTVYDTLTRLTIYLDGAIADTENTAFTAEKNQKAVNSAVGAWRSAVAIIKGNAKENEIWDETLQHLADDSSLKMGEIDDYQRLVQNFMDKIDLESGVIPEKSIQALDSFTPKFLPAATMHPELPSSQNTEDASYANLFTKKEK
jgi:chromosome segregation ATPase